jgi:1-acyl-sn-glycerol-3-phosphate acyltransferase
MAGPALVRGLLGGLFIAPWTGLVTTSAVLMAKVTGEYSWVPAAERLWARGLLKAWNVDVEVVGGQGLNSTQPHVIMSNHASHADVPILFQTLPVVPGFIAKRELDRIPFLSMALRAGGHVLVDRSSQASRTRALKTAAADVRGGKTIVIFPEGTRGDGKALGPFKKGGMVLAKLSRVPIVPVGIRGSHAILPRAGFVPRSGRVSVHIGEPIPPSVTSSLTAEDLLALVRERIAELCGFSAPHSSESAEPERSASLQEAGGAIGCP